MPYVWLVQFNQEWVTMVRVRCILFEFHKLFVHLIDLIHIFFQGFYDTYVDPYAQRQQDFYCPSAQIGDKDCGLGLDNIGRFFPH